MSGFEGAEADIYVEAMRLVPAIAAARLRDSPNDAFTLYAGYLSDAKAANVKPETAWAALSAAATVWVANLLESQAQTQGVCNCVVIEQAIAVAQDWVATGGK